MKLLQISEPCPICGEGVACLQQDNGCDGKPLYYRECNFCTSDYAGLYESDLNRATNIANYVLPMGQESQSRDSVLQSELLNKE